MSKESKLIKNTGIIAIGNICTKFISFFMLPLYTSLLSTSEYGTVDVIGTYVALIAVILTLQFEQGIFRFLIDVRNNVELQKKYISTAFYIVLGLCILFSLIAVPILVYFNYKYTFQLIIYVFGLSINAIVLQIPRGLGNNILYAAGSCISGSLNVILNVLFIAIFKLGVNGMLFASIISIFLSIIFIFKSLKLHKFLRIEYVKRKIFNELIEYSFPLIPNTLCWWVVSASDRIIINFFLNIVANGIYSVACKFPSMFSMFSNIFQMAWTESAAINVSDFGSNKYFEKIINQAIRFYSACNIGVIVIMPFVFSILIKNDFVDAYFYIPILMTGAFFHSVADLYGSIYTAFKMTKEIAKTTLISAVLNILINVMMIRYIGIYAAAISTLMAYLVIAIYRHLDVQRKMKITISKKYLLMEIIIYILVFSVYYLKNGLLQIGIFAIVIPYYTWQNRNIIFGIIKGIMKK